MYNFSVVISHKISTRDNTLNIISRPHNRCCNGVFRLVISHCRPKHASFTAVCNRLMDRRETDGDRLN